MNPGPATDAASPPAPPNRPGAHPLTGFWQAVRGCMVEGYSTFSGRSSRAQYWWFSLLYVLVAGAGAALALILGSWWWVLVAVPLVPPMLGVSVRRLHDTGRTGWHMLTALIPVAGPLVYLYLMALPSVPHGWARLGPGDVRSGFDRSRH